MLQRKCDKYKLKRTLRRYLLLRIEFEIVSITLSQLPTLSLSNVVRADTSDQEFGALSSGTELLNMNCSDREILLHFVKSVTLLTKITARSSKGRSAVWLSKGLYYEVRMHWH